MDVCAQSIDLTFVRGILDAKGKVLHATKSEDAAAGTKKKKSVRASLASKVQEMETKYQFDLTQPLGINVCTSVHFYFIFCISMNVVAHYYVRARANVLG